MKGNGVGYNTASYHSNDNSKGVDDGNIVNGFTYTKGETNTPAAVNAKIEVNKIFLPLNFWFNRNPGLALPLIALQYHEVKIRMTFESDTRLARYSGQNLTFDDTVKSHHYAVPIRGDSNDTNTKIVMKMIFDYADKNDSTLVVCTHDDRVKSFFSNSMVIK